MRSATSEAEAEKAAAQDQWQKTNRITRIGRVCHPAHSACKQNDGVLPVDPANRNAMQNDGVLPVDPATRKCNEENARALVCDAE